MVAAQLSQVEPRRCPLCRGLLGVRQDEEARAVEFRFVHTSEGCRTNTVARISALETALDSCQRELVTQDANVRELGQWIGTMSTIVQSGVKWIAMRDKLRAESGPITGHIETEHLEAVLRNAVERVGVRNGKVR